MTEQPDLDWKAAGYGAPNNEWDELAKDVAALANSGDGIIVIGVRDEHQTAAALRLKTPATLSDPEENSYRREIFSRTHPPVQGVSFQRLRGVADDEQAVAIHVPASLDAPHLIYKDRQRMLFACPFRDGTGTNWMPNGSSRRPTGSASRPVHTKNAAFRRCTTTLLQPLTRPSARTSSPSPGRISRGLQPSDAWTARRSEPSSKAHTGCRHRSSPAAGPFRLHRC